MATSTPLPPSTPPRWRSPFPRPNILNSIRQWIDRIEVRSVRLAHLICSLIPATCPFAHQFVLFGLSVRIPPLCELNPFYNEFVFLRFRALSYLSDVCCENVERYTHS